MRNNKHAKISTRVCVQKIQLVLSTAAAPTPLFATSNTNQNAGTGFGGINTGQNTAFGSAFGSTAQPNQVIKETSKGIQLDERVTFRYSRRASASRSRIYNFIIFLHRVLVYLIRTNQLLTHPPPRPRLDSPASVKHNRATRVQLYSELRLELER